MTSPGGCLVWAQPGTDKASVVAAAVGAAIDKGRTVLLTSPDGRAVDEALTRLITVSKDVRGNFRPGIVVRLPYGEVAQAVDDHPHMVDDKAAAALVHRDQRLATIARTEQANHDDPVRSNELWLRLRVQEDDKDGAIRRLDEQSVVYDEWLDWTNRRTLLRHERDELLDSITATNKTLATYDGADLKVTTLSAELSAERRQRDTRIRQVQALTAQMDAATRERAAQQAQLAEVKGLGAEWDHQRAALESSIDELSEFIDDAGTALRGPREELVTHEARATSIEQRLNDALSVQDARDTVEQRLTDLQREVNLRNLQMRDCEQEMAVRRRVLGDPPAWLVRYQQAEADGKFAQVHRWGESAQQVAQLDDELVRLTAQRAKVEADYQQQWLALPAEAEVVAAPLDALVLEEGLATRRFDVVIIDDAGYADAAKVSFAASLADRTCAILGGPAAAIGGPAAPLDWADDLDGTAYAPAVGDPDEPDEPYPWRVAAVPATAAPPAVEPEPKYEAEPEDDRNIFALAGITDLASAEKHPRCIVLT